jgi:hypothetical protein
MVDSERAEEKKTKLRGTYSLVDITRFNYKRVLLFACHNFTCIADQMQIYHAASSGALDKMN